MSDIVAAGGKAVAIQASVAKADGPGMVETEGTHSAGFIGSDFEQDAVKGMPLGRIGQPGDIAEVALFLASDAARWVTGERIEAGGGIRR